MTKKMVKRTDANNEILYFYTHSDAVDVGEGNATISLTNALNNKADASDLQSLSNTVNTKASASDLQALSNVVATKASTSDLNSLNNVVLKKTEQALTQAEKDQVHNNLDSDDFLDERAVRYDEYQVLGSDEKELALVNLGLNGVDAEPTKNSQKMVRSGGVAGAIDNVQYARFDGIQETSVTLNTSTTATADGAVLFYVPNNVFIYKVGSTYYTLWNNTNRLTNGFYNDGESTPHALTTKIFINTEDGLPYSFDGTDFTTVAIDDEPIPNSDNLVKSGGVEKFVYLEEDALQTAELVSRAHINVDGSINSTSSYYSTFILSNNNYSRVHGVASGYIAKPVVAFYTGVPGADTFISGKEIYCTTSYQPYLYDALIPEGCKYIAIVWYSYNVVEHSCVADKRISSAIKETQEILDNTIINLDGLTKTVGANNLISVNIKSSKKNIVAATGAFVDNNFAKGITDYIPVQEGGYFTIIEGVSQPNNSSYAFGAFYSDTDGTPILPTLIDTTLLGQEITNRAIKVPEGAHYVVLYCTSDAKKVKLLNGRSVFGRLDTLEETVEPLNSQIQSISATVEEEGKTLDALVTTTPAVKFTPSDYTLINQLYKNDVAETTSYASYNSLTLIPVVEGQTIYWHKWQHTSQLTIIAAIYCYDNDGLPFNGTDARFNYRNLTTKDYENGEYSFVIPTNCSQIGLSSNFAAYPAQDGAEIVISEESYEFTDLAKDMINDVVDTDVDVEVTDSSKYYLKGNSNIQYDTNKKLGIIAAGQSNIDGRNSYSDYPYLSSNPNPKVHFKNSASAFSSFEVTDGGQNNDWSFDAIVYNLLTEASHGNLSDIYVMKKSMGGTSIDPMGATSYHWTADYEFLSSETYSLLRSFESVVRGGIASDGNNFEIKAMLWHQGEGDSSIKEVADRYYENLKNMLAYARGIVGNPRLHVFCGNISENRPSLGYVPTINAAYAKLASEDPYLHVVDMKNAVLEDSWHFNYQWSIYFGQKVYDAFIDAGIITGTKINPTEPN